VLLALVLAAGACVTAPARERTSVSPKPPPSIEPQGIFKLDHLIFVVQENRSFDHYFGTYPGADGIPKNVCVPHPMLDDKCMEPYHGTNLNNVGGPHGKTPAVRDINGGKMDGFIRSTLISDKTDDCTREPFADRCDAKTGPQRQPDVMSYFTRREIPNYWAYADEYVLQDRIFESVDSFSLPSHMMLISGWAASCKNPHDPMSCTSNPTVKQTSAYPWTDITWLLHREGVSWAYYVGDGTRLCKGWPDCPPLHKPTQTPYNWNPAPGFLTIKQNGQLKNIRHVADFFERAETGDLPQVAWVIPGRMYSEHPGQSNVRDGEAYVTEVVNAVMQGPAWETTAIFVTWDDWGGFYDHVKPPRVDALGYGLRVPGLLISPYAKKGFIDHQTLSYDAYLKLIEDRFLGGQRLDPKTDGRPDSRPSVREYEKILGDLIKEFDFDQEPREPLILKP